MTEEKKPLTEKLIYLIGCALESAVPEKEQLLGTDLSALYRLAQAHSLTAMVCMALDKTDVFSGAEPETVQRWKEAKDKAIRKNMLLDAERGQILGELEKEGIWYLPLKGIILQKLYPVYGMRQMSDNDILYDASRRKDLKALLLRRGYVPEKKKNTVHDAYMKTPVYNFEMHTALFSDTNNSEWADYYRNVEKRLVPDRNQEFGRHFTDEDFYVYMMVHACKHYSHGGTGIRTLVDIYVYDRNKSGRMDRAYVLSELKKLDIAEFEKESRELAWKLFDRRQPFSMEELTEKEKKMLAYYVSSGTYGTEENVVKNRLKKLGEDGEEITGRTRLQYYRSRLFPEMDWYKKYFPFFYRHPYLIPFLWVYRILRGILFRRKKLRREIEILKKS